MPLSWLPSNSNINAPLSCTRATLTPFCAQVGGHGDLARVGLVQGMPPPAPPAQLYDWDLATAALAAAHAVSRELKAAAFPPPPSFQPAPQPPLPGEPGSAFLCHSRCPTYLKSSSLAVCRITGVPLDTRIRIRRSCVAYKAGMRKQA